MAKSILNGWLMEERNRRKMFMWSIILIFLGIGAKIVMANNWFIIPEYIPYLLFGLAAVLVVIKFVVTLSAKKQTKNIMRRW